MRMMTHERHKMKVKIGETMLSAKQIIVKLKIIR